MPSEEAPSEHRLHPTSVLFNLVSQVRQVAFPAAAFLIGAGYAGVGMLATGALVMVPIAAAAAVRWFTFRYRYEADEMVIRSGLLFRNERHVPYARIQNLDAEQSVLHRLLNVLVVKVETGGGTKAEATMSVVPLADFEEMRRRVFAGRERDDVIEPGAEAIEPEERAIQAQENGIEPGESAIGPEADAALDGPGPGPVPFLATQAPAAERTLLGLSPADLLLHGVIVNRGFFVILGGLGFLWEMGLLDGLSNRVFGEGTSGRGVVRDVVRAMFEQGEWPLERLALSFAAMFGALAILFLISPAWALIRLHGFKLTRAGDDLRSEFGLLTRVISTIPAHRIQAVTIRETPLHRLFRRVSVKVETAGGNDPSQGGSELKLDKQRDWIAPIIRTDQLAGLLHELLPGFDYDAVDWRPHHPRAFRRELKQWALLALLFSLPFAWFLRWWTLAPLALFLGWAFLGARGTIAYMRWAATDRAILYRRGWIWRHVGVAPFRKIQVVAMLESPFDRRNRMARVRADTAGAGHIPGAEQFAGSVDIRYLPRETAGDLSAMLAERAADTAFVW